MTSREQMLIETDVLIAGAGPVGLILAHELSQRGVRVLLVERNLHSTRHPKMDITNARSMEHLRRLGLASQIRAHATPPHHPVSVIWTDRLGGNPLARFDYPSYEEALEQQRRIQDGTGVAEPLLRISQIILEPLLCELLKQNNKQAQVQFGWHLDGFTEHADHVISQITHVPTGETRVVHSQYLAGCDGAGSQVRRQLGIPWDVMDPRLGPLAAIQHKYGWTAAAGTAVRVLKRGRKIPDGRVYLIHFKSKDLTFLHRNGVFWHEQCAQTGDTLIAQDDVDTWTLHVIMDATMDPKRMDAKAVLHERLGRNIECEILTANAWRPALTIAQQFGRGRVWLAGDACHQVIPTGGYGMNTGVGEAVTLGWMLAAKLQGWGGPKLLPAYEAERRPIIEANRQGSALNAGVRLMIAARAGRAHDRRATYIRKLGNLENEALGLEVDYRYDASPIICHESGPSHSWRIDAITPSTRPGSRLPHVWLEPGLSVFDRLSQGFTLIRTADIDVSRFEHAAQTLNFPLSVLDIRNPDVTQLYQRSLLLIRPDQHVAWRGFTTPMEVASILKRVSGHH